MGRAIQRTVLAAFALLAVSGCDLVTGPKPLEEFTWIAVEDPNEIQEGIDAAAFFGDVSFVGQFRTPTLCFNITPSFEQNGSTLLLTVRARSTGASNCAQTPGGFRYQGVLRHLGTGSYTLRVIHDVEGQEALEYTEAVTIG